MEGRRRMLGLDVGERRIGVAVSEGRVAVPLAVIEHRDRAAGIARVVEAAREHEATAIVVGLPLRPSGGEGEQARRTRRFGELLAARVDIPVVYEDETLSTRDAEGAVREAGRGRRKPAPVDDLAAAVILQRYIDQHGDGA
jgi:putative Holliday junction resolvase